MRESNGLIYHCIKCGGIWGEGRDAESHGICPKCFVEWCKKRQRDKGLRECFGEFKQHEDVNCDICARKDKCKEYYGIR